MSFEERRTILIVDDEESIRKLLEAKALRLGYLPHVVVDGEEALRVLLSSVEIGGVISDHTMPGRVSGLELFRRVRELPHRGGLPLLLFSGFIESYELAELELLGAGFLQKPKLSGEVFQAFAKLVK